LPLHYVLLQGELCLLARYLPFTMLGFFLRFRFIGNSVKSKMDCGVA
jgi:hypothetical protein